MSRASISKLFLSRSDLENVRKWTYKVGMPEARSECINNVALQNVVSFLLANEIY